MSAMTEFFIISIIMIAVVLWEYRAHVRDLRSGKARLFLPRSPQWAKIRREHLVKQPVCQACGSKENLEVHHKMPFHKEPAKELDPNNLITLCESGANGVNCHLAWGHLGSFRSYNVHVERDAAEWKHRVEGRP